jgi:hypothetical protein
MKAILKATGEIVTVECRWVTTIGGNEVLRFIDQKTGYSYTEHQLAILFQEDNNREPDYWTRLEHQYAGMIVQGMVEHNGINFLNDAILNVAVQKAHALVGKMKEERK